MEFIKNFFEHLKNVLPKDRQPDLNKILLDAIQNNQLPVVKYFLENQVNVNGGSYLFEKNQLFIYLIYLIDLSWLIWLIWLI